MMTQKDIDTVLQELPIKHCDSRFCPEVGPYISGQIVFAGKPFREIVGWCYTCEHYVCVDCAIWESSTREALLELDDNELKRIFYELGELPVTLRCHHCGDFLGQERSLVVITKEYVYL